MAVLNQLDIQQLWIQAGGPPDKATLASAVAEAESSGNPAAIDNTSAPSKPEYHEPGPGASIEYSLGLWQINLLAHPTYTEQALLDPLGNARAAVAISNSGADFGAWSTYTSGAYKTFLLVGPEPPADTGPLAGQPPGGPPLQDYGSDAKALDGWDSMRKAVNSTLVAQLLRSQTLRDQAAKALHVG